MGGSPATQVPHDLLSESAAAGPAWGRRAAIGLTLLGLAVSWWFAALSEGVHHDDDLTHYQMARWSAVFPQYLLHDWGRPGFTVLYALPAQFGWVAARGLSGLLTAATAWLAYLIARRFEIRAAWAAPVFVWLQPYAFTLSYTTLTETPLAFYLALAFWLLLRERYAWCAAVISLGAVTRHEAVLFILIFAVEFARRRRPWREFALLLWAPLMQNVLTLVLLGDAPPLLRFLAPKPTEEYGHGGWLAMLLRWEMAAGVGTLALAWIGGVALWTRRDARLWVMCGAAYFLAHVIIFRFGLFASGGYERFLVPVAPVLAVCAVAAFSRLRELLTAADVVRRSLHAIGAIGLLWLAAYVEAGDFYDAKVRLIFIAAMSAAVGDALLNLLLARGRAVRVVPVFLAAMVVGTIAQPVASAMLFPPWVQICRPLKLTSREQSFADALAFVSANGLDGRAMHVASPWFDHFLDRAVPPRNEGITHRLDYVEPGDLVMWDPREFASPRHGAPLEMLLATGMFIERWRSDCDEGGQVCCIVFECVSPDRGDDCP